jgi:uncharacterized protein
MTRLAASLASTGGSVAYEVDFDRDELGIAYMAVRAQAELAMVCQRTLETFVLPIAIDTRLGLIVREEEEAGLPEGYEPLMVENDHLRPADVIEDELLLALPLIPVKPGAAESELVWSSGPDIEPEPEPERENPFSVLGRLKNK